MSKTCEKNMCQNPPPAPPSPAAIPMVHVLETQGWAPSARLGSMVVDLVKVGLSHLLIGNPYTGFINPYYWVDEFIPLCFGEIMGL